MSQIPSHRLRWWLRGERAFGLRHVYAPGSGVAELTAPAEPAALAGAAVPTVPAERAAAVEPPARTNLRSSAGPLAVDTVEPRAERGANRPSAATPDQAIAVPAPAVLFAAGVGVGLPGGPAGLEPFTSPELSPDEKAAALRALDEQHVKGCVKCPLSRGRRNTVFGEGNPDADLMFVGEGPGGTEDQTGRPFVGRAGQKLDEMIKAMKRSRGDVYIANVVKCRAFLPGPPPKDRPPQPDEASACMPYLQRQIELVRPKVIVTLGLSATQYLLGVKQSMSRMRGHWHAFRGIPVMPTFHPSYILRNYTPETRRAVWDDLKQAMDKLPQRSSERPG